MARAKCPMCNGYNTWAHYEHLGCPSGAPDPSTGNTVYSWEKEAELLPDGTPATMPCPACHDDIKHRPVYLICRDCGHRW